MNCAASVAGFGGKFPAVPLSLGGELQAFLPLVGWCVGEVTL